MGWTLPFTTAAVVVAELFVASPSSSSRRSRPSAACDDELLTVARTSAPGRPPASSASHCRSPFSGLGTGAALAWARALRRVRGDADVRRQPLRADADPAARPSTLRWRRDLRPAKALSVLLVAVALAVLLPLGRTVIAGDLRARPAALRSSGDFPARSRIRVRERARPLLLGPNGAGKTTLLRAIVGALPVRQGKVRLGDRVLLDTETGIDIPPRSRHIGWVPQDYALFPHLTVADNVALRRPAARGAAKLGGWLASWSGSVSPRCATRRPGPSPVGTAESAALARALAAEPEALLLDEPMAALDARTRESTREFLARMLQELGIPVPGRDARRR